MSLPQDMLVAVYRERGRLEVERRDLPEPGPRGVLIRVDFCGICGTDLHLVMEGWGRPGSIGGHEYAGIVAAVGDRVDDFAIGDRVVMGALPGCGRCTLCRSGRSGLCGQRDEPGVTPFQGAFAEYARADHRQLVRVPAGLSQREAALAEPLAVALHGITLSGLQPGERALVTGAGPIGALSVAALCARGASEVIVSEPSEGRRTLATRVGATRALDPGELDVPPMPFDLVDEPVDAVLECSGKKAAFETGLAQLRRAGRLVIVGTGMDRPALDSNRILLNELAVTGAYCYDDGGMEAALALLATGRLPTDHLIDGRDIGLDGMQRAMEELVAARIAGKVMVAPGSLEEGA